MSNKRSLHMFQQASPKRRKSSAPQLTDTVPNHDNHSARESPIYPQHPAYQQPYLNQNHSFQPDQNQNRNFYDVTRSTSDKPEPGNFYRPSNNLGYNPGQDMMGAYNNASAPRPQYIGGGGSGGNKMHSYQSDSGYLSDRTASYAPVNNYQHQNAAPTTYVMNNRQASHSSSLEGKSQLYKLNHVNPGSPSHSHESNVSPAGPGPELYGPSTHPAVRYYNPPLNPGRYPIPGSLQQPRSNPLQQQHLQAQHHLQPQHHLQAQQLPHQSQCAQQTMPSPNSWGYNGSRPAPNHHVPTTALGDQSQNQPQPFPTTQYKIDSGFHQRQASKNRLSEPKSEIKSGEKKSAVSKGRNIDYGKKRIVTCNISAMLHWAKLKHSAQFMFEIFACLHSAERRSEVSYKLELRDSENNQLTAQYYLSSTTLPDLVAGKYYRLIGKMTNGTFHCFKLKEVPYMETRNAMGLIKQSEIAMSKLILQINEN